MGAPAVAGLATVRSPQCPPQVCGHTGPTHPHCPQVAGAHRAMLVKVSPLSFYLVTAPFPFPVPVPQLLL